MKNWTPHPYQLTAARHALENPGAALFLEPGLGKTSTSLAVIQTLQNADQIRGTLVIAPLRVAYSVWSGEVAKWAEFNNMSVAVLHGPRKGELLRQHHHIYTINPEGLPWLVKELATMEAQPFNYLILDESTKFKNAGGTRYKLMLSILKGCDRVTLLTGTPAANRLEDLFGQLKVIDGGERLGRYMTHFHREYFNEKRNHRLGFSEWFPRADTALRIKEKIADVCLYMSAEDYLSMPKLTHNTINVELPVDARRTYRQISNDFFAVAGDGKQVSAVHAAAAQNKLRQIVGGTVYSEEGVAEIHAAKLDALEDLVEEANGQPLLVAVNFQHEAAAVQAMLKAKFQIDAPYLGAGISPKESDRVAAEWNAGNLPVILAHPASVGHGLNLQAGGNAVCWYTLPWSLEEYDQLNRRVYRQGQEKPVVIHHIIATDTVDEDVLEVLQGRATAQGSFLNSLKRKAA